MKNIYIFIKYFLLNMDTGNNRKSFAERMIKFVVTKCTNALNMKHSIDIVSYSKIDIERGEKKNEFEEKQYPKSFIGFNRNIAIFWSGLSLTIIFIISKSITFLAYTLFLVQVRKFDTIPDYVYTVSVIVGVIAAFIFLINIIRKIWNNISKNIGLDKVPRENKRFLAQGVKWLLQTIILATVFIFLFVIFFETDTKKIVILKFSLDKIFHYGENIYLRYIPELISVFVTSFLVLLEFCYLSNFIVKCRNPRKSMKNRRKWYIMYIIFLVFLTLIISFIISMLLQDIKLPKKVLHIENN